MKKFISLILILVVCIGLSACSTGVVPPGTAVIKLSTSGATQTFTKGKYTTWGRDRLYFVDTKLKSFREQMNVLCKDKVNMSVDIKWIGSFDISSKEKINIIKEKVPSTRETFDGKTGNVLDLSKFYKTAMKDIIRNAGRINISPYVTDNIPENRIAIEAAIRKRVVERLTSLNYPVSTSDVLISNLDFEKSQTEQRQAIKKAELDDELKAAKAKAAVAQAKRDAEIAREKGKALIETAKAEAAANKILNDSLTPAVIIIKQYEAFKTMASGPNNEAMIIPYEAITPQNMDAFINRQSFRSGR